MQGSYKLINEDSIPGSDEMEKVLLGTILLSPSVLPDIMQIISAPEVFMNPVHESLFRLMTKLYEDGRSIDLHTVGVKSRSDKYLKDTCSPAYLVAMTMMAGSGSNAEQHAMILMDKYIARKLAETCMLIASAACDDTNDISDVLQEAGKKMDDLNEIAAGSSYAKDLGSVVKKSMIEAENRYSRAINGQTIGIPTGLYNLDQMICGWQPSTLNIIAARPAMGKTAIMLHFAKSAAKAGYPGCIYSLEMSDISLANRLILSECDVDANNFRTGKLTQEDWNELSKAEGRLSKLPIYIDDKAIVSMRYVKAHSTVMNRKGMCKWIMLDYLQLAETEQANGRNREQEIARASRQAKIIAKSLNIPVILLSQLNRSVESRGDKKPSLADLRESGAIEQDADTVAFIYRPSYYKIEAINSTSQGYISDTRNYGQYIVAKQRDGATGTVSFLHNDSMTKIEDYSKFRHDVMLKNSSESDSSNDNEPF